MKFKDYFSTQAEEYSKYRPKYPPDLFGYLSTLVKRHELAWDSATGNGQAALGLTPYFKKIIATDASFSQIQNAKYNPKIEYWVAPSESSTIPEASVDLITVATAIHWLDLKRFYEETRRVALPGSVIAVWNYFRAEITPGIDEVSTNLSENFLFSYWPTEARKIMRFEEEITFPFEKITTPHFYIEENWTLRDYMNYLFTWSSVQNFIKSKGINPLETLYIEFRNAWGDEDIIRTVKWEIKMKAGKIR